MRRLVSILAVLALLVSVSAVSPGKAFATHSAQCRQGSDGGAKAGDTLVGRLYGYSAVAATFHAFGIPETCYDDGSDLFSATSFWIDMEPYPAQYESIVQVGMVNCNDAGIPGYWQGTDPCESGLSNSWRFFYAFGGCNANVPWPRDLGPAGITDDNSFSIVTDGANVVDFYINGSKRASIGYSQMSCWSNLATNFEFVSCETHDTADSCGGFADGGHLQAYNVRGRDARSNTWITTNVVPSPCAISGTAGGRYNCWPSEGNKVDFWTVQ